MMHDPEKERFYVGLTDAGQGWYWTTFQSRPDQATADATGFIAVGESFATADEAHEKAKVLNAVLGR